MSIAANHTSQTEVSRHQADEGLPLPNAQRPWSKTIMVPKFAAVLATLLVLAGLYAASFYDYLLFHSLAEVFSIVIGFGIFMVAWNTRRYTTDHYLLLIGIAYLFIGALDFVHMLAYEGMNVFTGYGANAATQLWIAARYIEALTFLAAPLLLDRKIQPVFYFLVYGTLFAGVLLTIFYWPVFPACYLPDAGGLTPFKIISEYVICLLLFVSGGLVLQHRARFDSDFATLLLLSIAATMLAELAFTAYGSVFSFSNFVGHFLKIVSFYLLYKAVIETGLAKPYNLLFKNLSQELVAAKHLQQVSLAMVQADNIQVLYDRILDTAVTIMQADFACIHILYPEKRMLQLLGHRGLNEQAAQFWARVGPESASPYAMALGIQERMVLPDVLASNALQGSPDLKIFIQNGIRAVQTTPLTSRSGKLLGMLSTHWRSSHDPTSHELRALDLLARQAADLIDRKWAEEVLRTNQERLRLLAAVAGRLLRSEDPLAIVEDLCRLTMIHLDCQFFFHYLVDDSGQALRLNAYNGISTEKAHEIRQLDFGTAVSGSVARDQRRMIVERLQQSDDPVTALARSFGVQAFCCHPLMVQGELIGTLAFGTGNRQKFTTEEVALMKSIADQVSVAMQRLQTEKAMQQLNTTLMEQVAERTALAEARAKQLQALAVDLIEAEENERQQFAQLLHDDLQQMLAAAKMHLEAVHENHPDPMLTRVEEILAESIAKSRRLSHDLSPAVLHQAGLFAALQWLAGQMKEQFELHVKLVTHAEQQLECAPLNSFLFRAVQELLFNTVKHAGVRSARVAVSGNANTLTITVSDQGRGFNPDGINACEEKAGFGLLSIRERASYIGGQLIIESSPGKGSRFTLTVPMVLSATEASSARQSAGAQPYPSGQLPEAITGAENLRLLLVDDHTAMRQGLIQLIDPQPGIQVVGEAANGREALAKAQDLRPDVIIMDVSMPEMDGIEATRRIRSVMPHVRVIGLSMHEDEHITRTMQDAGAETLISKTVSSAELIRAIFGMQPVENQPLIRMAPKPLGK
jgi:signal transduction histidine kinase/ActR/RegA family two-component response regulator